MELLCTKQTTSDMPMPHAARVQAGQAATKLQIDRPQSEVVRLTSKNDA